MRKVQPDLCKVHENSAWMNFLDDGILLWFGTDLKFFVVQPQNIFLTQKESIYWRSCVKMVLIIPEQPAIT